jgi:predicted RNA-binding Zn-ribbon protein involved in translation (DUF1610 family)
MSDIQKISSEEKFCSSCRAVIKRDAAFCPHCGERVLPRGAPPAQRNPEKGTAPTPGKPPIMTIILAIASTLVVVGIDTGMVRGIFETTVGFIIFSVVLCLVCGFFVCRCINKVCAVKFKGGTRTASVVITSILFFLGTVFLTPVTVLKAVSPDGVYYATERIVGTLNLSGVMDRKIDITPYLKTAGQAQYFARMYTDDDFFIAEIMRNNQVNLSEILNEYPFIDEDAANRFLISIKYKALDYMRSRSPELMNLVDTTLASVDFEQLDDLIRYIAPQGSFTMRTVIDVIDDVLIAMLISFLGRMQLIALIILGVYASIIAIAAICTRRN